MFRLPLLLICLAVLVLQLSFGAALWLIVAAGVLGALEIGWFFVAPLLAPAPGPRR